MEKFKKKLLSEANFGETFIDPFVDVFKTIVHESKRAFITLRTMIWVLIVPFPGMIRKSLYNYDNTMKKMDQEYLSIAKK